MILRAIELTHVGRFRETVRIGPLSPGLNILAAPNESGKSTALRATARALFDRHTTKGDEIKSLQPAGTDLAPRVAVEFETRTGRFRIEKTFLQTPTSVLKQWQSGAWQPLAEADLADQRVQALLSSSLPGRGATKPEHWGFLGFLWARQDEPAAWPGLQDAAVGQRIRARLARVELDPVIEQLRTQLAVAAEAILTAGGKPKVGGPLAVAEDDLMVIETELATLRQTRADLDSVHQRYQQASAVVAQLEKEHAERSASAVTLREQTLAAERLRGELEARRLALTTAKEKLATISADVEALARRRADLATTQKELAKAEAEALTAEERLSQLRAKLDAAQSERPRLDAQLQSLRAEQQRVQFLLKLRQMVISADVLVRTFAKAEAAAAEITVLEERKARLPSLTPVKLRRLEELGESVRTLRAELQALGLTVELTPERDAVITAVGGSELATPRPQGGLAAGETFRLHRPQAVDLHLAGWGRVVIRSGAQDAQTAAARLAETEKTHRQALLETGVTTVDAARDAMSVRRDLDLQLKSALAALGPHLGDHESLEKLREAVAGAARRVAALTATLQPSADEQTRSLTDLETDEARHTELIPAADRALKAFDRQLDQLRTDERTAAQAVQAAANRVSGHHARLRTLETQAGDLVARYPDGLDAAKETAQIVFFQAEARVVATTAELPPDFEKFPERNRRAAAALQHLANELQTHRAERDQTKGTLGTLGGQGLYSRETELEEKKAEALLRRDAARARGWSARIAHDLIEHRKQAATKAVLTPLEQRLTTAFAELTGDRSREVFLDEHLQVHGIGRTRDETHAFENLSQGAKEQLLLCLRLAVAQELAADEPQVLILDDVLVNTDSVRQERILDVLAAHAARLQILVLTCHPDRYRGLGEALLIK